MTALIDGLCVIGAAMLLPIAWHNPRLRAVVPYGRYAEWLMWISVGALALAMLLRPR